MLRSVGCSVIEAANGDEALAQASAHPPAIVATDLRMPGAATSLDVCRHFAALGVPVIVVTGVTPGPEYHEVEGAGRAAVTPKPITPDALVAEIHRVLELAERPPRG